MLANAVWRHLFVGWKSSEHYCFWSVSLTYIFSVFPVRRCMLFLTCILEFTLCCIIVCLFDALTFSDFAEYYTHRCAVQTCTWSMALLTSTAVFRSPFFHEMLFSDCPWTAAFIRSAQRGILWRGGWKAGSCHHRVYVNVVPLALGW